MSDGMERYIRGLIVQRGEAAALEVALDELGKARARLTLYPELVAALRVNTETCQCPVQEPGMHWVSCEKARAVVARADEIEGK